MLLFSESLSHGALGWSTVCDCVISRSYLHFCIINVNMYKNNVPNPSKKCGKDQESIQSSTTPDPGYHMGK